MKYALLYVLSVVLVNVAFDYVPLLTLPEGSLWSPVALIVGFIFVIRDYAQRAVGHKVLLAMLAGGVISWFMVKPEIALASVCAFMAGEMIDWAVFTFTGRPFSSRILISSALATPFDSAIFLGMVGILSIPSLLLMTLSKMIGAVIVAYLARRRETLACTG